MWKIGPAKVRELEKKLLELENKQRDLRDQINEFLPSQNQDGSKLDQALRNLARRLVGGRPQVGYINEKFRSNDFAALNIKQLGYQIGRTLADTKLRREVKAPGGAALKSSLCTQSDIESDWFAFWCQEMKVAPVYHRKLWELCYVSQVVWMAGKLAPGSSGLGFGCGTEPLPSMFAKYGVNILATDLDPSRPEAKGWQQTNQHGDSAEGFRNRRVCADEKLLKNIAYRPVDMNEIPRDLDAKFDFCWSACALEHVGSIEKGFAFIENSLRTLKPGGVAVHTTEFNLENDETIDNWPTVLFQKKHIVEFAARMSARGFHVEPLDFNPGNQVLDGFVDIPPWKHETLLLLNPPSAHLKLCFDGFPCTSVGLIIRVPPNG